MHQGREYSLRVFAKLAVLPDFKWSPSRASRQMSRNPNMRSFASHFSTAEIRKVRDAPDFLSVLIVDPISQCRTPDGHQFDTRTVSCSEPLTNGYEAHSVLNGQVPLLFDGPGRTHCSRWGSLPLVNMNNTNRFSSKRCVGS